MTITEIARSRATSQPTERTGHDWRTVSTRPAGRPPHRGAYWQFVILTRVALAKDDLTKVRANREVDGMGLEQIEELLSVAEEAARRPASIARLWPSGSAINRAFINLHAAQVLLAKYTPCDELDLRLLSAMTRLRATMPWTEARRSVLEHHYGTVTSTAHEASQPNGRVKRWVLEKALEWSYGATDAQYARLRSFRKVLTAISIALLVLAAGLAIMGFFWPETLQLCFDGLAGKPVCPTGERASARDALVIEVLGATGGALAAVLAVRKMRGTSTPYSVPLALAMLKLPLGATSALVGLLLIHGRFIPGLTDLDTSGQILAYAIFLGAAQQSVTGLIDRRGQELLENMPAKRGHGDPPSRTAPRGHEPHPENGSWAESAQTTATQEAS